MYKYAITGASGWLGTTLIKSILNGLDDIEEVNQLPHNQKIKCLLLPGERIIEPLNSDNRIDIVYGDLRSEKSINDFLYNAEDAVLIHTAGIIHPNKKVSEFYAINLEASVNLVSKAKQYGLKKAVILSSNSPIGCNPTRDHRFTENSPYNPYMHYGRSKMQMEQSLISQFSEDFPITIIRAPWFYGPYQPERQLTFFQMIRDGKCPIVGDGNNVRSMVHVENLAQGILLSAQNKAANNEIFWIADERAYTMNEIVDTIEQLLEDKFNVPCKQKRLQLPSIVSEIAFVLDFLIQKIGFYHQKIHVLSEMNKNIACDISKAKKLLGYKPKHNLREGIVKSIEEYLDSKNYPYNE